MFRGSARARFVGGAALIVAAVGGLVAVVRGEGNQVTTESFCTAVEQAKLPEQLSWGLQDYGYIERNLTLLSRLGYPDAIGDEADRVIKRTPVYLAGAARNDFDDYDREAQERDHAMGVAMDDDLTVIKEFIDRNC